MVKYWGTTGWELLAPLPGTCRRVAAAHVLQLLFHDLVVCTNAAPFGFLQEQRAVNVAAQVKEFADPMMAHPDSWFFLQAISVAAGIAQPARATSSE